MKSKIYLLMQDFPNGFDLWGDNMGKMAKNCRKITKSKFFAQNSGTTWRGNTNFLGNGNKVVLILWNTNLGNSEN